MRGGQGRPKIGRQCRTRCLSLRTSPQLELSMARQKNPLSKARLTGADKKDPQRYRGRSEPDGGGPVGDPPSYLTADAKKVWKLFVLELPWLKRSDRATLEAISTLRARIMLGGELPTSAMIRELRASLSSLGATPVSRQAVKWQPEDDTPDPFAFFNGQAQ